METQQELLEIYKLHVEMADRVSQRRLQTNRFYIALLSGLFAFVTLLFNKDLLVWHGKIILLVFSILGMILCLIWLINIHSYKQLNSGKFKAIHGLEQQLRYPVLLNYK